MNLVPGQTPSTPEYAIRRSTSHRMRAASTAASAAALTWAAASSVEPLVSISTIRSAGKEAVAPPVQLHPPGAWSPSLGSVFTLAPPQRSPSIQLARPLTSSQVMRLAAAFASAALAAAFGDKGSDSGPLGRGIAL
ncbi:MAG: hypothetical protein WDN24_21690 [Sphingomonas sp.]